MAKRTILFLTAAAAALYSSQSDAADTLKFGPAASWIVPQVIPPASDKLKDRPIVVLLHDQQIFLERGKISTYSELAFKIQKPEGLAAGNLSVEWNPAFDTATVNRLEIRRGDTVIDVLKSGQTFTTMRRESNLDLAMLDGILTANIQPEGLQEGDVVVLATTIEHSDPVLKGHVESVFAPWSAAEIGLAHARLTWPSAMDVRIQKTGDLPGGQPAASDGRKVLDLTMKDVEPVISPKGAPLRFKVGRLGEATDFRSWADAARLMAPLYRDAAIIPASGPLREEVEKIRTSSPSAKARIEQALQLVQQRIRYVALAMGEGSLVPTTAEVTWSRRFGDCKAKTALLLAVLHELGISAEPVLVNAIAGDAVADRLPMIEVFNHVLVRAHVDGKDYWLDGTRTGDTALDQIEVPKFGWGLPLLDNASLVRIIPAPLENPNSEVRIDVDATEGIFAPVKVTISQLFRGDGAVAFDRAYSQLSADQRSQFLHRNAKSHVDSIAGDSSKVEFDEPKRELTISTKGTAKLDWQDGWFSVPDSSIAYAPDFDRPPGPLQDSPFATDYPNFEVRTIRIKLPPAFEPRPSKLPDPVHETLTGIEYERTISLADDVLTVRSSERSVAPEIPYKDAIAAVARLKKLNDDDVYLRVPNNYRASTQDLAAKIAERPNSAQEFIDRGLMLLDHRKFDEAIADFTEAARLAPKNPWAVANRALAYLYKNNFTAAAKDIAAAEAIDPGNSVLWRAKGLRAEEQGDPASAYMFYSKSLTVDPGNNFALFRRAIVSMSQHKSADALRDVNEVLSVSPLNADALALRATIYANMGKSEEARNDLAAARAAGPNATGVTFAEVVLAQDDNDYKAQVATFTRLLTANPRNPAVLVSRGQAYYKLERYDDALADTEQALKLGYYEPDLRVLRANVFMMRHDYAAVAGEAEAMVRDNPNSDYAFVAAGMTYNALGRKAEAMKAFDRALALKPDAYIYINRARVRPYADAAGRLADLDAALKLDPANVDALAIKARERAKAKDYAGALALYDRIAALEPHNKDLPLQRASALYKSGRTAEAEKILEAQRGAAKTAEDFNSICGAEAMLGGALLKSALQDCEAALKLQAKFSYALGNLALIKLRAGQYDAAIANYTDAISNRPTALFYLGRAIAYSRKGDTARAQADRAEALKLDADEEAELAEYGLKI